VSPAAGRWERGLLGLEGLRDAGFLAALCDLAAADHALLWAPDGAGIHRLVLATPLPGEAQAGAARGFRPGEDPFWEPLAGRLALEQGGELARVPAAGFFPEARWALAAAGPEGSFSALLVGRGRPPAALAADPLLAGALLRRLGEQVSGDHARAQAASEALARLSHEFKTPLVSIKGYAELLLDRTDEPLSERARDWLRRIAVAANRLAALFGKVTAEARTEAPWTYLPEPLDPREWARRCVAEAEALAEGRRLRWTVEVPGGLGPLALDRDAGRDLLLELLQNAARSTPDGGSVRVSACAEERQGAPGVRLTVTDTGVGIPGGPASDHLFDRFASLGSALEHHSGDFEFGAAGPGLGLAMVRGAVRAHGGAAWAEGRGRDPVALPGAAFHVWLPRVREAGPTDRGEPSVSGGRLLVLDQDLEGCRILEQALRGDYDVTCVRTAQEALDLWGEGAWAGCVVEPRLPPGGGVDLVRALRAGAPGPGAVILTYSTGGASETAAWRAAGADGCVAKPARARLLAQRLRTLGARKGKR